MAGWSPGPRPRGRRLRPAPAARTGPRARARLDRPSLLMRTAALAAVLVIACGGPATPAGDDRPLPEGNAYVRGLVDKQRHREELLDHYTYDLLAVREDLDDEGRVEERHTRRYEVFFVLGRP